MFIIITIISIIIMIIIIIIIVVVIDTTTTTTTTKKKKKKKKVAAADFPASHAGKRTLKGAKGGACKRGVGVNKYQKYQTVLASGFDTLRHFLIFVLLQRPFCQCHVCRPLRTRRWSRGFQSFALDPLSRN